MPNILLEGYTTDEILSLPAELMQAIILSDEALAANMLGRFCVSGDTLIMELAHVDGGGEGALPALASLANRYAQREGLQFLEWRVHAVHCAKPNLKLRRVLERRGFVVRELPDVGECFWLRSAVNTWPKR